MTNMISRRLIAGLALATLSLSFAPTHADTLDNIKKAGKVRIAIDTAIPPFGMTDDKLQPTGSDVDTAQLLAKDLGVGGLIAESVQDPRCQLALRVVVRRLAHHALFLRQLLVQ